MKKAIQTTLAVGVALALTACNNGGVNSPKTTLDISGKVVKGVLAFATVNVYAASDIAKKTILATTQTDKDGEYSVQVVDPTGASIAGAYVVEIKADSDTTMRCDASACGDVARGQSIPAEQLDGLTLSTFTYSDGKEEISADITSLTTMATDAILSTVALNGLGIDLTNLSAADALDLQEDASEVVGSLLGVNLSQSNLFTIDIPDASVSADVSTTDTTLATLTLINASISGLKVATGSTLVKEISTFFDAVETISAAVFANPNVNLATTASTALTKFNDIKADIAQEVTDIIVAVELDLEGASKLPVGEITAELDEEALSKVVGEIIKATGGTGGTGGTAGTGT